ncbi:hypothetical protein XENTR_v10011043 [Xenopus tropicalis]|nr:hypothetical protein XENTR_v10011043 [Xenopus tropicalis]
MDSQHISIFRHLPLMEKSHGPKSHCVTWGSNHYLTFDKVQYTFSGQCSYQFASDCSPSATFDIYTQKVQVDDDYRVYFTVIIDDLLIKVEDEGITVDGNQIAFPYTKKGVDIDDACENLKIKSKIGLITWNWGDDFKIELSDTYRGKTCGLCGNSDGNTSNDLVWQGHSVSPVLFGNVHKVSGPADDCSDVSEFDSKETEQETCKQQRLECENLLSRMGNCKDLLDSYPDYLQTCKEDLCNCESLNKTSCICSTLNQFSKECVLAESEKCNERKDNRNPVQWSDMTFQIKPDKADRTVLDDIHHRKQCVKLRNCPCVHGAKIFKPNENYATACHDCTCKFGHWSCTQFACSANCTLRGGSHISTFDAREFTFHGNCMYLMSKDTEKTFAVTAKIVQCGVSESVTCLNAVHITIGKVNIKICYCGNVYLNNFITLLPKYKDGVTLFKPTSHAVNVITPFGMTVQVEIKPIFQLSISVNATFKHKTTGLCGNFNGAQSDDMKTLSGVLETSASSFSNSWKSQASCSDVDDNFDNPCTNSIDREQFGTHWCSLLTNTSEVFAACHSYLEPHSYFKHCMYDVCNSDHAENALCMWLSAYVIDCGHRGVELQNWRNRVCDPIKTCPETMVFSYSPKPCNISCASLSEPDPLCKVPHIPLEGCTCPEGTFMTPNEKCVMPEKCPCNYKGRSVPPDEAIKVDEILCKCARGKLHCPKAFSMGDACDLPMYYFDCETAGPNAVGSECQKSCKTQDMQCYSKECVSGCVCPSGLVWNDDGDCILPSQCPCVYEGKFYETGVSIDIPCNTCTCKNRTWHCTENLCPQTCTVYGNGHYSTFDGSRFDFSGECDYILAQDFCPGNENAGSFRIITENIVCGEAESICSLGIKIILKNATIELFEGRAEESKRESNNSNFYTIDIIGLFIVLKTTDGLTFMWDQKTTAIVQLSQSFQGRVCGLCGNFDGLSVNDFTSSWQSLEENENVFADSWKVTPSCNSGIRENTCLTNPFKFPWAQKHCSLIKSEVFAPCHAKVDPIPYYDSCVTDSCSCNNGGDCECLCTSIAAYASACRRSNICIAWRTPDICPVFCDYYNKDGRCEWHYQPCGAPCLVTCRNPMGKCDNDTQHLEGCYPTCSNTHPYFDENTKHCVPVLNCTTCVPEENLCNERSAECLCCHEGKTYRFLQEISIILEGKSCVIGYCGADGDIILTSNVCGVITTVSTPARTSIPGPPSTGKIPTSQVLLTSKATSTTSVPMKTSTVHPGISRTSERTTHITTPYRYSLTQSFVSFTNYSRILITTKGVSSATTSSLERKSTSPKTQKTYSRTSVPIHIPVTTQNITPTAPATEKTFTLLTTAPATERTSTLLTTVPELGSKSTLLTTVPGLRSKSTLLTTVPGLRSKSTLLTTVPGLRSKSTLLTTVPGLRSKSTLLTTAPASGSKSTLLTTAPASGSKSTLLTTIPKVSSKSATTHAISSNATTPLKTTVKELSAKTKFPSTTTLVSKERENVTQLFTRKTLTTSSPHVTIPTAGDCQMMTYNEYIAKGECITQQKVSVSYCAGHCPTFARYSYEAEMMTRQCSCCTETHKSTRNVQLHCPNGTVSPYTYIHVELCSCMQVKCFQETVGNP